MSNIIEITNINKSYKRFVREGSFLGAVKSLFKRKYVVVPALSDISLTLESGKITGLLGLNGAGKSTLMKILTGIIQPDSGSVKILNQTPSHANHKLKKEISVVLGKKSQLWWDISPEESFELIAKMYDLDDSTYKTRKTKLALLLNLQEILQTPTRNLSLGERMKCELLAALLHEPKVIILDEPTIGLDIQAQKAIRQFLVSYVKESNATVLLTSHSTDDIFEMCDDLVVLKGGKISHKLSLEALKLSHLKTEKIKVKFEDEKSQAIFLSLNTDFKVDGEYVQSSITPENKICVLQKVSSMGGIRDISIESVDANALIINQLSG